MPNHIHAIIEIVLQKGNNKVGEFKSPSQSVGSIIRGYKIAVIKRYRELTRIEGVIKIWQHRFYDVIIRDRISFQRITQYIIDNPKRWDEKK